MNKDTHCPCKSGKLYADCCAPILNNKCIAETAEQLMRSRYTAFTLADSTYLLKSWASETKPSTLNVEDESVIQWIGLDIEECTNGGLLDMDGSVTFTASFISSGQLCHLHEKSNFIKRDGHWYYLGGKTKSTAQKVGRNEKCPCGSGKKYKKCCC